MTTFSRRWFLSATAMGLVSCGQRKEQAATPKLRVTAFELIPVRATERTVWLFVRLQTDAGITGLGEASDAYGFANTTKQNADNMQAELARCFELVKGRSPLDIAAFRAAGRDRARTAGLPAATAFSAVEQALWDLTCQALGLPIHALFGGKLRDRLPVYANINRATKPRTPAGFADTARRAYADGFRAMKAAPFDGFPPKDAPATAIRAAVDQGIAALVAMREAVGPEAALMVDCHSFFDVPLAREVARRLESVNLAWYEEPVAPERIAETVAIHESIRQPMAGGEILFGVEGFAPLSRNRINVIMPDVKHCGGLLEMSHIAAAAAVDGVAVAPHNPSGPVSTLASAHMCATIPNFRLLELQWGEVPWRGEMLDPPERFESGLLTVPTRPGLGAKLNDKLAREHRLA